MIKITKISGGQTIQKTVNELEAMGFKRYTQTSIEANIKRLRKLNKGEIEKLKGVILEISPVYYRRLVGGRKLYANKESVRKFIEEKG